MIDNVLLELHSWDTSRMFRPTQSTVRADVTQQILYNMIYSTTAEWWLQNKKPSNNANTKLGHLVQSQ